MKTIKLGSLYLDPSRSTTREDAYRYLGLMLDSFRFQPDHTGIAKHFDFDTILSEAKTELDLIQPWNISEFEFSRKLRLYRLCSTSGGGFRIVVFFENEMIDMRFVMEVSDDSNLL